MSGTIKPISKRELLAYQADVKGSIFRQIREMLSRLKEQGFTQKELAEKIGMDPGQLSRRLRGDYDLQLETLSDLARGLDCRIDVKLAPIAQASEARQSIKSSLLGRAAASAGFLDQVPLRSADVPSTRIDTLNDNDPPTSARRLAELRAQA